MRQDLSDDEEVKFNSFSKLMGHRPTPTLEFGFKEVKNVKIVSPLPASDEKESAHENTRLISTRQTDFEKSVSNSNKMLKCVNFKKAKQRNDEVTYENREKFPCEGIKRVNEFTVLNQSRPLDFNFNKMERKESS